MEDVLHISVLIAHVLGAAIIVGVSFVTLIIELKNYTTDKVLELTEYIWKITGTILGIQILTGLYLAITQWDQIGSSPYFWTKMVLIVVGGFVVGPVNRNRLKQMKEAKKNKKTSWTYISFLSYTHCHTWSHYC